MNESVFFLYLWNFFLIGGLPIFFFKKGQKNIKWWATAAPFFLCAFFLIAMAFGLFSFLPGYSTWRSRTDIVATALAICSISLISYTIGSHRIPLNLWHQDNDQPDHIVTYGPYRIVRHPFYTAFLLSLLGALIFCPHIVTLVTFIYGVAILNATAAKEETKLLKYDESYRSYMRQTGRFFPKLF